MVAQYSNRLKGQMAADSAKTQTARKRGSRAIILTLLNSTRITVHSATASPSAVSRFLRGKKPHVYDGPESDVGRVEKQPHGGAAQQGFGKGEGRRLRKRQYTGFQQGRHHDTGEHGDADPYANRPRPGKFYRGGMCHVRGGRR